mmetsp:Transcript_25169/g.60080  ORF Transcript_25169/g.60080 Transcript_25169/m.60080 type:complete len:230 (-) Transcript_25169:577-1266(-)
MPEGRGSRAHEVRDNDLATLHCDLEGSGTLSVWGLGRGEEGVDKVVAELRGDEQVPGFESDERGRGRDSVEERQLEALHGRAAHRDSQPVQIPRLSLEDVVCRARSDGYGGRCRDEEGLVERCSFTAGDDGDDAPPIRLLERNLILRAHNHPTRPVRAAEEGDEEVRSGVDCLCGLARYHPTARFHLIPRQHLVALRAASGRGRVWVHGAEQLQTSEERCGVAHVHSNQ